MHSVTNPSDQKPLAESDAAHPSVTLLCPACDCVRDHARVFRVNACDILRCSHCGLGRAVTTEFDPESYYTESYFNGSHDDGYADYRGSEAILRREFRKVVDELAEHLPPGGHILEVGCAYGFLLLEARDRYKVSGIEIAEDAVRSCREAGLADVHQGVVSQELLDKIGPVDAIVMLDVIEHLPNPESDLTLLARMLRPGGVFVISTGDFSSPLARIMGPRWRLMTPPQHLWYFTPESMRGLARRAGLEFKRLNYPWKLVPLGLIAFQLRRMFGLGGSGEHGGAPARIGLPLNLFDAMRVTMRKPA